MTYTYESRGLNTRPRPRASARRLPPWVQERPAGPGDPQAREAGDADAGRQMGQLFRPRVRRKVLPDWFQERKPKPLTGKTPAKSRASATRTPEDAAMDLVIEDDSRVSTVVTSHERRKCPASDRAAVCELRVGRGYAGDRRGLSESSAPSAGISQFRRVYARYVRDEKLPAMARRCAG